MKKLLIEVVNGIMDDTAYVYDIDGTKICEASGSDNYKAIQNVCLKLADEIIDIKNNKKQIEFFKTVDKGTKVKYKYMNDYKYGYFVKVSNSDKEMVVISKLPKDDGFTGITMTSYGMYENVDTKLVEVVK